MFSPQDSSSYSEPFSSHLLLDETVQVVVFQSEIFNMFSSSHFHPLFAVMQSQTADIRKIEQRSKVLRCELVKKWCIVSLVSHHPDPPGR